MELKTAGAAPVREFLDGEALADIFKRANALRLCRTWHILAFIIAQQESGTRPSWAETLFP